MLAIFENGTEVLICEVDAEGKPMVADYFDEGNGRIQEEMDLTMVNAPIMVTRGSLRSVFEALTDAERIIALRTFRAKVI